MESTGGEGFVTTESHLMGKIGAFLEIARVEQPERDPAKRTADFKEFVHTLPVEGLREQGARCMECGVPFCHNGCPLGNLIPDWNDLVYRDRWREAIVQLHATNNFPEFTGKLCPAPCEAACVLEIREGDAVTIKQIEVSIVNRALGRGLDRAAAAEGRDRPHRRRDRRRPGRAGGRAAAAPRRPRGHRLRARRGRRRPGPLRRPALQDREVGRRAAARAADRRGRASSATASTSASDVDAAELRAAHDAVVIATGSRVPRDLPVPGRELDGVHFAMEYLYDRARCLDGNTPENPITAAASTSWSSAAATPARTASATRTARARRR